MRLSPSRTALSGVSLLALFAAVPALAQSTANPGTIATMTKKPTWEAVNSHRISEVGTPILLLLNGIDAKMEERSLKFSELMKRNATASPKVDLIYQSRCLFTQMI